MTIYDDFQSRESVIWSSPFLHSFRFSTSQATERVTIFGLYAGTYLNGKDYLKAIDDFELALIVDKYNQQMAGLDADEQNVLLDIVTKRYIANVDRVIFQAGLVTEREKIAAEDSEWDAKIAALAADEAAITTVQAHLTAKELEVSARIQTIQAAITIEGVDLSLADAEVSEKELAVSKAENTLVIKTAEVTRKDAEIVSLGADLAKRNVDILEKDLAIDNEAVTILKLQLNEAETEQQILRAALDVSKVQLQVVEAGIKSLAYQKEAAQTRIQELHVEEDIAKTVMIQVDLADAEIEKSMAEISNAEKENRRAMIEQEIARTDLKTREVVLDYMDADKEAIRLKIEATGIEEKIAETDVLEAQANAEEARYNGEVASLGIYDSKISVIEAQTNQIEAETTAATAELGDIASIHQAETSFEDAKHQERMADLAFHEQETLAGYDEKTRALDNNADTFKSSKTFVEQLTDASIGKLEDQEEVQEYRYDAEIAAIEDVLSANIITTLGHSIGIST